MQLSYAVSLQATNFSAVASGDWVSQLKLLGSYCYPAVELAVRDVNKVDRIQLDSLLKEYNFKISALGTGQIFLAEGLSLSIRDNQIRQQAVDRIKNHLGFAKEYGAAVIIGLARGTNLAGHSDSSFALFSESMKELCAYSQRLNVQLLLEPINRYETCFINTVEQAVQFIVELKAPNLKVLLDTFHMNIEEKNFAQAIEQAQDFTGYVHFADSNRRYPGCGHIDFDQIIQKLKTINYNGYISAEFMVWPDFKTCVKEYSSFMENRI